MDKLDKVPPKDLKPLKDNPIAQGIVSNTIFQIGWNGAPTMLSWIVTYSALLWGIGPHWAILIGAFVFFLVAVSVSILRRKKETDALNAANTTQPVELRPQQPPNQIEGDERERLKDKIDGLHIDLHTERKSSRETIERLRGQRDDLRQQNEQLSKDLTRVREGRAEWQVKYQKANNSALEASGERDTLKLQLMTSGIEKENLKLEFDAVKKECSEKRAALELATKRLKQEEIQRDNWIQLYNKAERELGELRWLEGRMKQQAENLDTWVRIKTANRVKLQLTTTPRRVIIAFWVKNNSIFTVTFNFKFLTGCLRFKNGSLHDPITLSKRCNPIEDLEPGALVEIILVQPLLRTEAETILDARQNGDPNAIFSLADLNIPLFVRNIPQEVAAAKLKIHSEIEFMNVSEFPCGINVDETDIS